MVQQSRFMPAQKVSSLVIALAHRIGMRPITLSFTDYI